MAPKKYPKIKSITFPEGNTYEGSPCTIHFVDETTMITIADSAYQLAYEDKLSKEEMQAIGL